MTQVIPIAGGFTEFADEDDHRHPPREGEQKVRVEVDFNRIIKGKAEDVPIKPGDTIIVP
ncbi:MAG: hypothetical protein MZU91_03260 [Desulfosudis oleivorans]|nr:hypothetical protein [Desulfosudis oleivorans]